MTEKKPESKLAPQPPNYKELIDEQTWAFIDRTDSWYPPETIDFSIEQQRQTYNAMCGEFNQGHPTGIDATNGAIKNFGHHIPVRRYTYKNRKTHTLIVYFHGGGFVVGGLDSHDDVCAELCAQTGFDVTAVDYSLAPENLHPAAFQDSLACVESEYARLGVPILLCGDSAGGNLAAAVAHSVRDNELSSNTAIIAGQVLIYPALGSKTTAGSYITHANAPMLTTRDVNFYRDVRTDDDQSAHDTTLEPLTDNDFSNLPSTAVFSAECDPLSDDGKNYCEAITAAGGKASWTNEIGLVHGYLRGRHSVERAQRSFERIVESLNELGNSCV